MLKKTLQCLEGIHLSQSGSLLMLYVDKLLSTPFRVLARMVDTLACRRVEMLLAETKQVHLIEFICTKELASHVRNAVLFVHRSNEKWMPITHCLCFCPWNMLMDATVCSLVIDYSDCSHFRTA